MYKLILIILISSCLLLLMTSCSILGTRENTSHKTSSQTGELGVVYSNYLLLSGQLPTDRYGWVYGGDCDGVLFESLLSVGANRDTDIASGQISNGHWYRNPQLEGCSTDISRDMMLGIYWYMYTFSRLDLAENTWTYGSENNWKMGEGDSRTILTPGMISLLAKLIHHLGGISHSERYYTETQYNTTPGYVSHLTVLHILLDGELNTQKITARQLDILQTLVDRNPMNPLFQAALHKYTDGDQSVASNLLLATWPHDRLPTSADWCESWRTQRADTDGGLQPCDRNQTHSGGDLLFVTKLILEY